MVIFKIANSSIIAVVVTLKLNGAGIETQKLEWKLN